MQRNCNVLHIRCHGSDVGMQNECIARREMFVDDGNIGTNERVGSAHKQLEVKVRVETSVRMSPIVYVGRRGDIEEEEMVIEVMMCEGVRV